MQNQIGALQIPDFQVAIRQAVCPALRERPVVVASSLRPMGRVLCVSEAARNGGVTPGMQVALVQSLCSDALLLPPDPEQEARAMGALLDELYTLTPRIETAGSGRVTFDLSGTERLWQVPLDLASRLRKRLASRYALASCLGLTPRKTWSLLAGRFVQHNTGQSGILEILPDQIPSFLGLVPPTWVDGIGPKTNGLLLDLNISRLLQLTQFQTGELVDLFGAQGRLLADAIDLSREDPKILPLMQGQTGSHQARGEHCLKCHYALHEESAGEETVQAALHRTAQDLGRQLRARHRVATSLRLTLIYGDGRTGSRSLHLRPPPRLDSHLLTAITALGQKVRTRRIRVAEIQLHCVTAREPVQRTLFAQAKEETLEVQRLAALDTIRNRFGFDAIRTGNCIQAACHKQ